MAGMGFFEIIGKALLGAVVSYATSAITSKLFGKKNQSSSPTYSIGTLQTQCNSNMVMPIIYGTVKSAGNSLWQNGSGSVVNRLVGFSIGKNAGVSDVRLDDVPMVSTAVILISNSQFSATVECKKFMSTKTLTLIANGINNDVSANVTAAELVQTINALGNGWVASTDVGTEFVKDYIDVGTYTCPFMCAKENTLPGCSYTAYMGDGVQQIDGRVDKDTVTTYEYTNTVPAGVQTGETWSDGSNTWTAFYDTSTKTVRGRRSTGTTSKALTTQEDKARVVGGLKYDAYLALTIKASDKISSNPNVTAVWKGRVVKIYTSPTEYHEAWSNNVWCVLDFMTSEDGCGIPIEQIDIASFISAAAYAQPGDGSRDWQINLILDEEKSRQDWLNDMLLCFRAFRTYQNGKHGIVIDKAEPVSQIFTVNPTESIQIDWQEMSEDIERLIIKYPDPDYEWQNVGAPATMKPPFRNAIYDANKNLLSNGNPLTKTIEIHGITNFKQASQHAWFYLNQAQTCGEYITYTCNNRAINRTVGDVIGIFDPITQRTDPGLAYKRYRIMAMTEPQGMQIQMYCREYNETIYGDTMGSVAPVVSVSKLPNSTTPPPAISDLAVSEYGWMTKDGMHISNIDITFTPSNYFDAVSYIVSVSSDGGETWRYVNTIADRSYRIGGIATGAYIVGVQPINKAGIVGTKTTAGINVVGKDAPPPNVTNLTATVNPANRTKAVLQWDAVDIIDLKSYRVVYEGITYYPSGNTQTVTSAKKTQSNASVVAVDNSGNVSVTPATILVPIVANPSSVPNFSVATEPTDRSVLNLAWGAVTDTDLSQHEVRCGSAYAGATVLQQTKANKFSYRVPASGYYKFWVVSINAAGVYGINPASTSIQVTCEPSVPTNLTATQNDRNRAQINLTWTAPSGLDIADYEVLRNNVSVGFTANAAYTDTLSASGTYVYKVRAKTVGGFSGSYASVTKIVMLEPMDVTGFTGAQLLDNRSKVRLTWNANSAGDMSHYVIKEGTSWDTGTVVADHAVGTYCDLSIDVERVYTWWIKAVSIGNKQSQFPASFSSIFSMNPSAPTNFKVVTNPKDRSRAIASWNSVSDADFFEYELRCGGTSWENADVISASTKETSYEWEPLVSNSYTLRLKARNTAKFESDEVMAVYNSHIEPSNVSNFIASQNGDNVLLVWTKVSDADIAGYEVREGSTFDNGTIIATGINDMQYQFPVDMETTKQFWIKAINRAGNYSQEAISSSVTISNLTPRNVISTADEITLQTGSANGVEFGESSITFGTLGGRFSNYPSTRFSDIGGEDVLKLKEYDRTFTRATTAYLGNTAFAAGVPRINEDGFLIEEGTTNLAITKAFSGNGTPIVTSTTDYQCSGEMAAKIITGTAGNFFLNTATDITQTAGTEFTVSCKIRRADGSAITGIGGYVYVSNNTNVAPSRTVTPVGDGWYQLVATRTGLTSGAVSLAGFYGFGADSTIYVDDFQIEAKPYATSFAGMGATRNADYLSAPGNVINTVEGTIELDFIAPSAAKMSAAYYPILVNANSGVTSNTLRLNILSGFLSGFVGNGSSYNMLTTKTPLVVGTKYRAALRWNGTEASVWLNGVNEATVAMTPQILQGSACCIGSYGQSNFGIDSQISNVRISNIARGDDEMANVGELSIDANTTWMAPLNTPTPWGYNRTGSYVSTVKDMGKIITANITCAWSPSVLFAAGTTATLEYRTSNDNATWSQWIPFVPTKATFRYAQLRASLATGDVTKTPEVNQLALSIDVPDTDKYGSATIAVGGTMVSFGYTYWQAPFVVATAIGAGLRAEVTARTLTGATIKVVNAITGADVGGSITWHSRGY